MNFTPERCKDLIGGFRHSVPMLNGFEKLCDCLDKNGSDYNTNCPCSDIKNNNEFMEALEEFKKCFKGNETSTVTLPATQLNLFSNLTSQQFPNDLQQSLISSLPFKLPNVLEFLTNDCYTKALKSIIGSNNITEVCGVNVAEHKGKIEAVITVLETLQTSTHYTLKSVRAVDSAFIFAEKMFTRIINEIKNFQIAIPMCISLSVTVILILMFYKIYTGGPLFGRRKKKKKKRLDYDLDEETQFMPMPMAMPTPMPMAMPMPMPMAMPMAMPMPMPNDLSLGYQPMK